MIHGASGHLCLPPSPRYCLSMPPVTTTNTTTLLGGPATLLIFLENGIASGLYDRIQPSIYKFLANELKREKLGHKIKQIHKSIIASVSILDKEIESSDFQSSICQIDHLFCVLMLLSFFHAR